MIKFKKKLLFITNNIKKSFKNSFNYKGRSPRSEFWILQIFSIIFTSVVIFIFTGIETYTLDKTQNSIFMNFDTELDKGLSGDDLMKKYEKQLDIYLNLVFYFSYAIFLFPLLSLTVRRLHDFGKSGYVLILFLMISVPLEIIDLKRGWIADDTNLTYFWYALNIVWLLYLSQKSDKRKNKYGPVPKY